MNLCLETETFLFAVCFGKKNLKSYETEDRFFLHETTKLGVHCLANKENLNSPTFLLGKNQHTLKLSIHVLANREIENIQPFLLTRDPKTSNNQNMS